jgi:hypothetical protein
MRLLLAEKTRNWATKGDAGGGYAELTIISGEA